MAGLSVFIFIFIFIFKSISAMQRSAFPKGRESALQGTQENSPAIYPWVGIEYGRRGATNFHSATAPSVETLGYSLSWASPLRDLGVECPAFSA
jgi:hypothetical protein